MKKLINTLGYAHVNGQNAVDKKSDNREMAQGCQKKTLHLELKKEMRF